jgi:SanA protein
MKKLLRILVWMFVSLVGLIAVTNGIVIFSTKDLMKSDINDLKPVGAALVLGTSKSTSKGQENLFFKDRIRAAAQLYKSGKVKHILVSGDNRSVYYNEPRDMLNALQELGISEESVTLDYAGLRTLDSVVRSKEIFGQNEIIIVTQQFHAYRASFIARRYDMDTQVYLANFESETFPKLMVREVLARTLAVFDLYVFGNGPKYLGDKEPLEIAK